MTTLPDLNIEIVGRPPVTYKGPGSSNKNKRMALFDEIERTLDTGDAIRIKVEGNRGGFLGKIRSALKRRGIGMEWSRADREHVDLWAVPLKPKGVALDD